MTSSTDSSLLLRMLEPAVRPGQAAGPSRSGAAGGAGAAAGGGFETRSFEQLLQAVGQTGVDSGAAPTTTATDVSASPGAAAAADPVKIEAPSASPLAGLNRLDNPDVLRLIERNAAGRNLS
ncbi:MAG: hypothetical protein AAF288_03910 [Planctomycetota bacterium]